MNNGNTKKSPPEATSAKELEAAQMFGAMSKEFRSLDCSICDRPFGYQFRAEPSVLICTSRCLAVACKKLIEVPQEDELTCSRARTCSCENPRGLASRGTQVEAAATPTTTPKRTRAAQASEKPVAQFKELHELIEAGTGGSISIDANKKLDLNLLKFCGDLYSGHIDIEDIERTKTWFLSDMELSESFTDGALIFVSHAWDPVTYTLQAAMDEDCINDLQDEIRSYCRRAPALQIPPVVNQIVFATCPTDGIVYRAHVIKSSDFEDDMIEVDYVDFGEKGLVKLAQCWEPKQEIMQIHRRYGLVISLSIPDTVLEIPNLEACDDRFRNAIANNQFTLKVIQKGRVPNPWSASLITEDEEDFINLLPLVFPEEISNTEEPAINEIEEKPSLASQPPVIHRRAKKIHGMALSSSFLQGANVSVAHVWSNSKVTVTAEADAKALLDLDDRIQAFVKTVPPLVLAHKPEVEDIVLGLYYDSYYRAKIMEINGDDVMLEFLDYGDVSIIPAKHCRDISDELFKIPILGLKLHIQDLPAELPLISEKMEKISGLWELNVIGKLDFGEWRGQLWTADGKSFTEVVGA